MKRHPHLAFLVALLSASAVYVYAQSRRPMVVEDVFNLQTLGDIRISPDGTSIAFVQQRSWSDPETFRPYGMFGNDHADIWIMSAESGPARNITHVGKEGAGYWDPIWSPDRRDIDKRLLQNSPYRQRFRRAAALDSP